MVIYLIAGHAGAGKDTFAKLFGAILESKGYNVYHFHFAAKVKEAARVIGWDGKKDKRGRTLLQKLGTEIGREYDKDIWVKHIVNDIMQIPDKENNIVFIPDFRFENEYVRLKDILDNKNIDYNITTINIINVNGANLTNEQITHRSETSLDNFNFDITIKRDNEYNVYMSIINNIINVNNL